MLPLRPLQWSAARPTCWWPSWPPPCLYRSWWGWRGRSWFDSLSARPQSRWNVGSKEEKTGLFNCTELPAFCPGTNLQTQLWWTPILSISAVSKSFPLFENSMPSPLHSSYCSSCAAGVIHCLLPGVKLRKGGSLTATQEEKSAENNPPVTECWFG